MNTCIHLWQYIAELFLEWGMFQTNVVEKIKIHNLWSINLFRKSCCLQDNVENAVKVRRTTDCNITGHMRISCWVTKVTDTHAVYNTLLFHGNSGYAKESQCNVISTLPGLLQYICEYLNSIWKYLWFVSKRFITYAIWPGLFPAFTLY